LLEFFEELVKDCGSAAAAHFKVRNKQAEIRGTTSVREPSRKTAANHPQHFVWV
jgi:hypothetical protein